MPIAPAQGAAGSAKDRQVMRLFHFTGASYALQNIEHRRVKIAEIKDLNDPFDLRAPRLRNADQRKRWTAWRNDFGRQIGMICFSPHWKNVTMWSHYADKHRGICLGFDVDESIVDDVEYSCDRPEIDFSKRPAESDLQPLLFLKSTDWAYEQEYRVWTRLENPVDVGGQQLYFEPFSEKLKLREIVVGPLCEVTRAQLEPLLTPYQDKPKLLKARHAFHSFAVVTQQLGLK